MKTSQHNSLNEIKNEIGAKTFLEFAVHLLELEYFNPIVFCHDNRWFNKKRYAQIVIGFINLLSFLYSCRVMIETEVLVPSEIDVELYKKIMRDEDMASRIQCYELREVDFSDFTLQDARIPENCDESDFYLVMLYLQFRSGSALSKKTIENVSGRHFTDSEMLILRKQLENITGRSIIKRKDNSYEMR